MMARCRLTAMTLLVLAVAGCSDRAVSTPAPLTREQSQSALRKFGVTIPDSYTFISMTTSPPPLTGGADYNGVYESPIPPAPVEVDSVALPMSPTTCQELRRSDLPDGTHCESVSNLQLGSKTLTKTVDSLRVESATLPSGKSRIYLWVIGH